MRVSFDWIKAKKLSTSKVGTYFGRASLILKVPLRSLHTKGDFPNGTLHTGSMRVNKAERAEFTEL